MSSKYQNLVHISIGIQKTATAKNSINYWREHTLYLQHWCEYQKSFSCILNYRSLNITFTFNTKIIWYKILTICDQNIEIKRTWHEVNIYMIAIVSYNCLIYFTQKWFLGLFIYYLAFYRQLFLKKKKGFKLFYQKLS